MFCITSVLLPAPLPIDKYPKPFFTLDGLYCYYYEQNLFNYCYYRFNNDSKKDYQEHTPGTMINFGMGKLHSFIKDCFGIGGAPDLLEDFVFDSAGDKRAVE